MSATQSAITPLLWTAADVAARLQITEGTVHYLHKTKRLCGYQIGKCLLWRPADVETFVTGLQAGAQ